MKPTVAHPTYRTNSPCANLSELPGGCQSVSAGSSHTVSLKPDLLSGRFGTVAGSSSSEVSVRPFPAQSACSAAGPRTHPMHPNFNSAIEVGDTRLLDWDPRLTHRLGSHRIASALLQLTCATVAQNLPL